MKNRSYYSITNKIREMRAKIKKNPNKHPFDKEIERILLRKTCDKKTLSLFPKSVDIAQK